MESIELAIPQLREGSYFQEFLTRQRHTEHALVSVVAISYLLGGRLGGWTSWLSTLGITSVSVRRSRRGERAWMALSSSSRPGRR